MNRCSLSIVFDERNLSRDIFSDSPSSLIRSSRHRRRCVYIAANRFTCLKRLLSRTRAWKSTSAIGEKQSCLTAIEIPRDNTLSLQIAVVKRDEYSIALNMTEREVLLIWLENKSDSKVFHSISIQLVCDACLWEARDNRYYRFLKYPELIYCPR